jgi:hypothetical protein
MQLLSWTLQHSSSSSSRACHVIMPCKTDAVQEHLLLQSSSNSKAMLVQLQHKQWRKAHMQHLQQMLLRVLQDIQQQVIAQQ